MAAYQIKRMFFDDGVDNYVVKRGLTLEEAQVHCSDPNTSSSTCTDPLAVERTEKFGQWFDGYEEER